MLGDDVEALSNLIRIIRSNSFPYPSCKTLMMVMMMMMMMMMMARDRAGQDLSTFLETSILQNYNLEDSDLNDNL